MMMRLILGAALFTLALLYLGTSYAVAETAPQTEIVPLGYDNLALEKTTLPFYAPSDNTLPWAYVRGEVGNPAADYPVIIQIYDAHGSPVLFTQTAVDEDNRYEYQFRVRDVLQDGTVIKIFEGDYTVIVFKTVHQNDQTLV